MAQRRVARRASVSLFPFLSVLFCVIGVLIFVTTGMSMVMLESPMDETPLLAGSMGDKLATFVECDAEGLVLHAAGKRVNAQELNASEATPFTALLDELERESARRYLVFLVRPDGIASFDAAFPLAEARAIDVGQEALLGDETLHFQDAGTPHQRVRITRERRP